MTVHVGLKGLYSLSELANALAELEGLHGMLVAIGHQADETIGSYEEDKAGTMKIELRPGRPVPHPPGDVIDVDAVFINGQLQTVTAYRIA